MEALSRWFSRRTGCVPSGMTGSRSKPLYF
jgi:hypothetical protein